MNKKLAIRTVLMLLAIAAIFGIYQALQAYFKDFSGFGHADSVGAIVALEDTVSGTKAVAFDPNGTKREIPDGSESSRDTDFSWSPDGDFVYLASNRDPSSKTKGSGAFNIFRWKFGADHIETMTDQRRSMSAPRFSKADPPKMGVVIAGGNVLQAQFESSKTTLEQIMPPINKNRVAGSEGEGTSEGGSIYSKWGNSFRQAFYLPGHTGMLAVMRRDDGEVLVFHDFRMTGDPPQPKRPVGILAGSRIQLDVTDDGRFVVSQQDVTVPDPEQVPKEWLKDGKLFPNLGGTPFHHMIWYGNLDSDGVPHPSPMLPPAPKPEDEVLFLDPKISPDGKTLVVVLARRPKPNETSPQGLLLIPLAADGAGQPKPMIQGEIAQPSWSPDSTTILFTMMSSGKRSIYTMGADGSAPVKVAGDANYSFPQYSPQIKKKA